MPRIRRGTVALLSLFFAGFLDAQVRPRITERPDNSVLVRIPGSTHPAIATATWTGRAPVGLPMERMLLNLKSSPEQETELEQLLADQQDPSSPQYQAWLTPEQFGKRFAPPPQDIEVITDWLVSRGFQNIAVAAGGRSIEFSGAASDVEAAFHTEINRYQWNGREHIANSGDISIPAALASVVDGIASLHDFGARPLHHVIPTPVGQADFNGGVHGIAPYDFAAIYNVASLWSAGFDGTGQSIAIVGETNLKLSDVTGFRSTFGLPANNPTVIVNGSDPGILPGEETEADLDVEWAGAVTRGATIKFVVSASTNTTDGVTLSAQYIVNHAVAPVMSLSYGLCEVQMGSSASAFNSLWQQAAAEGIAVFVAAGDSGSAGCDAPYSTSGSGANTTKPAMYGFGINGLASTVYNVAVGGTEFNDTASPSTYWNSSNDSHVASAKGYIPEITWNESSYAAGSSSNSLYAGGGGASTIWPRPSWQAGQGIPTGSTRLIPDVSLAAAGHDGYVVEQEGALYLVGGTSASTPSFAGLMAIINQYTHASNGNPNGKLYALAAQAPSVFHDVTTGSNQVPCAGGTPNCSAGAPSSNLGKMTGYSAGVGYDLATGLGSVDAYALATHWGGSSVAPTVTSLSPNPMSGSTASQTLTVNGAGFVAGSGLKVMVGSASYTGSQVTFVSSSQLTVSVNVGVGAQSLAVQVVNPSGQASNDANLTVNPPVTAPVINSLNPNPMVGSVNVQTLTVNGTGFLPGLKLIIGSTVMSGVQLVLQTATQIQVNIITGISAHTYAVQVVNANGGTSKSVNFQVDAPPAPVITSLSPNPMTGGSGTQTLTINGSNFQSGMALKVTVGNTAYIGSQLTLVGSSQIKATVAVPAGAKNLPVQVTDPSGAPSNSATLTVK